MSMLKYFFEIGTDRSLFDGLHICANEKGSRWAGLVMRDAVNRLWRLAGTALSFGTFGLGALGLSLIWFAAVALVARRRCASAELRRRSAFASAFFCA